MILFAKYTLCIVTVIDIYDYYKHLNGTKLVFCVKNNPKAIEL